MQDNADLVIAALVYRLRALPVFDKAGRAVRLHSQTSSQALLVDGQCRVMDADGKPCLTCLLIGLAAGFVPHGKFGGEPSFGGQPNGLWLWQTMAHPLNALSPKAERDAGPGSDQDGGPANTMPECCVVGRANALPGTVFYTSDGAWRELGLRGLHDWLARSGAESIVTLQPTATIQRGFQLLDKSRRVATGLGQVLAVQILQKRLDQSPVPFGVLLQLQNRNAQGKRNHLGAFALHRKNNVPSQMGAGAIWRAPLSSPFDGPQITQRS